MSRLQYYPLAAFSILLGSCFGVANAQPPGAPRPTYSPYLNLTRPGNVANNYYGLVRPQVNATNAIYGLENQYNSLSQSVNNPSSADPNALVTGHQATFMNYSHYYNMRGGSFGSGMSGTASQSARMSTPMPARGRLPAAASSGYTAPRSRGQ